jgi:hypothetical protein
MDKREEELARFLYGFDLEFAIHEWQMSAGKYDLEHGLAYVGFLNGPALNSRGIANGGRRIPYAHLKPGRHAAESRCACILGHHPDKLAHLALGELPHLGCAVDGLRAGVGALKVDAGSYSSHRAKNRNIASD